ncbi:hypothetical protein OQA88_1343 [Cercophora sp. LCS_1]
MPEIFIGEYLFRRLKEIGIDTIFGVPGDYELALLDQVEPQGLSWIGTPNELIGAYAADGYARIKGAGAPVTTFGPGELSALCGIGGSFCENVPIVHIVGHYERMSSEISCATAVLRDTATAASEIDRVLNAMLYHSKPGYIGISEDVAYSKVSIEYLNTPLTKTLAPSAPEPAARAVAEIIKTLESAKAPILMVDGGAARGDWAPHVNSLIEALKIPFFQTMIGKGIANEESPYYHGSYGGAGSWPPNVQSTVESADCILWLGDYPSDFNTGIFSEDLSGITIIDLQRFHVKIGETTYDARINHILPQLISAFESHAPLHQLSLAPLSPIAFPSSPPKTIQHDWFWDRLSSFIQPTDLVITETGTCQAGINVTRFPAGAQGWTQGIYGSIGYAASATAGASIASLETGKFKRVVLVTGEGSLQLKVQALSLINRLGAPAVVLVLNNKGYTIERFFRGWTAGYNDVPMWDYGALAKAFSPEIDGVRTYKVGTGDELDRLLGDDEFATAQVARVVDMLMEVDDAPTGIFEVKRKVVSA